MSSASNPEGLAIARQLIAREAEERTGFLDLGRLGLVGLPEELLKLTHLRVLILGWGWRDSRGKEWQWAAHDLGGNDLRTGGEGLGALTSLEELHCYNTRLSDLQPLEKLTTLTCLDCSDTEVSDLQPLSQLAALSSLDCSETPVRDLEPLAKLSALTNLDFSQTRVTDLEPLAQLSSLITLNCCRTQVCDLLPLAKLKTLTTLDCSGTFVSDLQPLAKIFALTTLNCSGTDVRDLLPVAQLVALNSLDCSETQISDLQPLAKLAALNRLDCSSTQVDNLQPLSELTSLSALICYRIHVRDLQPLAKLSALTELNCSRTLVSNLQPLEKLSTLTTLNCSGIPVSDLQPLANLTALTTLFCSGIQFSDLQPVAKLTALNRLDCSRTQVSNLQPLAQLATLTMLDFSQTQVHDLQPLAKLTALTTLDCSHTQVSDLQPLAKLSTLINLNCFSTEVSDLQPLAKLSALTSLICTSTKVSDLRPLAKLSALTSLICASTQVSDLRPLAKLSALTSLYCANTLVSDLQPLAKLAALTWLDCSGTQVKALPDELIWQKSLTTLFASGLRIEGLPSEVLSANEHTNCLESLRSHLRDLEAGDELLPDVKVIVIGNGRIGKTQICRRLRGVEFESEADSTHGITVTSAELAATPARLHLWDFGGQDLYHGTHALFMKTRAVFVLVWTPAAENAETHEHGGMTFRNHPLAYWLSYVRHLGGTDSPVLLVQNQCDTPADELLYPPLERDALEGFGFPKLLHYSAKADRGRAALDEAMQEAIDWLRKKQGQARIGAGRLRVKRRLEALRDADALLPAAERRHRVISQEYFQEMCDEATGVSSAALLLDYLHQCGIVFYHKGLFGNRIVLDQAWALEAVYALFNRTKCYKQLQQLHGRFTRMLLEALVWQEFSVGEQKLFLSMMVNCGICFVHRQGSDDGKVETEYLAPDLLPERSEVAGEIEERWPASAPFEELVVDYPFLHAGVVRRVIAQVGQAAGISAVYWKEGVCGYERGTRSHLLLEVRRAAAGPKGAPQSYAGSIVVRASGAQPGELLHRVEKWIEQEGRRTGTAGYIVFSPTSSARRAHEVMTEVTEDGSVEEKASPKLEFDTPPRPATTYCVSYAWREDSIQMVNDLCSNAEARGIHILRDTNGLGLGERISQFMSRLAAGDRVFIILSAKYLQSPYCMAELFEVWRNCRGAAAEFLQHIRVFRLPDAAMMSPLERARCAVHWKQQFDDLNALVKEHGADILGESDFQRYKLMQDFAHRVGDILALIADTLLPKDFDELMQHGFAE